jgi:hypothetical protein
MATLLQTQTACVVKRRFLAVVTTVLVMLWVFPAGHTAVRVVLSALLILMILTRDVWTILITEWIWDRRPRASPALSGCGFCDYSGPILFSETGASAGICEACIRLALQELSDAMHSAPGAPRDSCSFCNRSHPDRDVYSRGKASICSECVHSFAKHLPRADGRPPVMPR